MKDTVRELRARAKKRKVPNYSRMNKGQLREALNITHGEPPVRHGSPGPVSTRAAPPGTMWPEGKPMPATYSRRQIPCPNCRRLLLDNRAQAAVCTSLRDHVAYFRCRSCGHRWKLPTGG